jgi:hypothetical protein
LPRYTRVILTNGDLDFDEYDYPLLPHLAVDGGTPEFTGILDADGNPIVRLPRPIGFGRDNEW